MMYTQEFIFDRFTLLENKGLFNYFVTAYEGDGSGSGDGDGSGSGDGTPSSGDGDGSGGDGDGDKGKNVLDDYIKKDDVNKIVQTRVGEEKVKAKERLDAADKKVEELLAKVQELEPIATMSEEQRTNLQKRVEELRSESLSEQQRLTKEKDEVQQMLDKVQTELKEQTTKWQTTHYEYRIHQELAKAATDNDARTPDQLINILTPRTRVVEVTDDDGKPTGRFEVKTQITIEKDGKDVDIELPTPEAVAKLRDMPKKWGNQFNSKSKEGLDIYTESMGGGSTSAPSEMPVDGTYADYQKWRKENGAKEMGLKT